jgi:hypothetical protein
VQKHIFARLAFIGASTTDGKGLGPGLRFCDVFRRFIAAERRGEELHRATERLRFPQVRGVIAESMVNEANKVDATLTIAVDFLFWFVYGRHQDRMASLNEGLALLDCVKGFVAVGTIPAVPRALVEWLPLDQRPSADELRRINERIAEWVAAHPNAILIPWAETAAAYPDLRQEDGLHTTEEGLIRIAEALVRALMAKGVALREDFAIVP